MSNVVSLSPNTEVEGETGQGGGQDTTVSTANDNDGDMTIDFGLTPYVSIGSTVFGDANNDGTFDEGTESGVSGITVNLYTDEDMDGIPDDGNNPTATTTTDEMGNYVFDSLLVGDYIVGVVPNDSLPLSSSPTTGEADDQVDNNDNGIQLLSGDEIFSNSINLMGGTEPAGETGQGGDQDDANSQDTNGDMTVDFGLYGTYDLAIEKSLNSSSTDPIAQGSTVTFDVTVTNEGTLDAYNVAVIDNIPSGLTLTDANWTLSGDTATLTTPIASIARGEMETVQITFTVDMDFMGTQITNVAQISDFTDVDGDPVTDTDSTPNNDDGDQSEDDEDPETINLGQTFDLALTKMEVDPTTYGLGDTVTFSINVLNQGSLDATDVQISDYVPNGLILVPGEGWTMIGDTARLDTPIATIAAGASEAVEIKFVIDPTTTLTEIINNAEIESADNILDVVDVDSPDYGDQDGTTPDPLDNDEAATDGSDDYDPATIELAPYVSIGSTVFSDVDNNGMFDEATEEGLSGITVSLYTDEDMDGIPDDVNSPTATTITDAMGNYLFDSLLVGDYVVGVTPTDSLPLSSIPTTASDDQTDNDDNGIQVASGDEIFSPSINLSGDSEPAGETGQGGDQDDANDTDGDMTVDFGLYGTYDLAIEKSLNNASTDPIAQGSTVTFDVIVTNEGTLDAYNVAVIDNIPSGLTLTDANWTLSGDTATLTTPIASIARGEMETVQITFTVDMDFMGTQITNVAQISDFTDEAGDPVTDEDSTPNNDDGDQSEDDEDPETINLGQTFDLALIKEVNAAQVLPIEPGQDVIFDINVLNQGSLDATDVQVSDYVPTGLTLNDANWMMVGDTARLVTPIASIAMGVTETVSIIFTVDADFQGVSITNNAEIESADNILDAPDVDSPDYGDQDGSIPDTNDDDTAATDGSDDYDPAEISVSQVFDLALLNTLVGPSTVSAGADVTFSVTVYNQGTLDATDITVTDYFPTGTTLVTGGDFADDGSGNIVATIADLAAGDSTQLTITVTVDEDFMGTVLTNNAEITEGTNALGQEDEDSPLSSVIGSSDDTTELGTDNDINDNPDNGSEEDDYDPAQVMVGQTFDLALLDTLMTPSPVIPGADVTFSVTVYNQGSLDATDITVTDYLPTGTTLVTGGDFADDGSGNIVATIADLAAGDSTQLTITVTVDEDFMGTVLTNNAEITEGTNALGQEDEDSPLSSVIGSSDDTTELGTDNDINDNPDNGMEEDDYDPAQVMVGQTFDLALLDTLIGTSPVNAGDTVTFGITIFNQGTLDATDVWIQNYLPTGTSLVPGGEFELVPMSIDSIVAGIDFLAAGDSVQILIQVAIDENNMDTLLTNNAEIIDATNALDQIDEDDDLAIHIGTSNDTTEVDTDNDINDSPDNMEDQDDYDPAQVSLNQVFDLALVKMIGLPTDSPLLPGGTVSFDITVINQGTIDAYDVQVNDYIPSGLILKDTDWVETMGVANLVTAIPTITAGMEETVSITFMVDPNFTGSGIVNNAEILKAFDVNGSLAEDRDSNPGDDSNNDPDPNDNDEDDTNGGDDFDPALIVIIQNASIGDTVWIDTNANGIFETGEVGIGGVVVNVLDVDGMIAGTTTTNTDGSWTVTELPTGDYQVQFVLDDLTGDWNISPQDQGGDDSNDSDAGQDGLTVFTTLEPGEYDTNWDLGIYQDASLGDYVWYDADEDGIFDSGEIPVEGATITLYNGDGIVAGTDVTDVNGLYLFEGLIPGSYYIGYQAMDSIMITQSNVGDDAFDSDIDPITGISVLTTLISGENDLSWDIGLIIDAQADIVDPCNCFFREYDEDDVFKFLDTIRITSTPGSSWTVTAQSGMFIVDPSLDISVPLGTSFLEIEPGVFILPVLHDDRVGYTVSAASGTQNVMIGGYCEGYDLEVAEVANPYCKYSDPTDLTGRAYIENIDIPGTLTFVLRDENGVESSTSIFDPSIYEVGDTVEIVGLFTPDDPELCPKTTVFEKILIIDCRASVGDQIWKDLNGDGLFNNGEPVVSGITVILQDCDGNDIASQQTDVDGTYLFEDLIPGEYQIEVDLTSLPEGCGITEQGSGNNESNADPLNGIIPCFTLLEDGIDLSFDVGLAPLTVNIGDFVWYDLDADGVQDSGEPGIADVTVYLYNDHNDIVAITTTNNAGQYIFEEIIPDVYYIVFADPEGYTVSDPNQGGNDELDSDVTNFIFNENGSTTDLFEIIPGQEDDFSFDAGYYICVPIGENVWYDITEDDIFDSFENGINGLTVNLYRLVNGGYVIYDQTTTAHKPGTPSDDGYFKFCAPPGTYYVEVIMPPIGLVQTIANVFGNTPLTSSNESTVDSDLTNNFGPSTTAAFTISSGDEICNIGAGFYPMATVGNLVWMDENNNGVQDEEEEKVSGVFVEAYNEYNEKVAESVTNNFGVYNIDYLQKQNYYLKFTPPTGYGFITPNVGDDDNDSDVSHAYGLNTTDLISMSPGENKVSVDAGIQFGVLPVEWLSISAEWKVDFNEVRWSTASESNNDLFEIERRHESEEEFYYIGQLDAAGNSTTLQKYVYEDKDIDRSGRYYYRIKQVDLDGKFDYSATVFAEVQKGKNTISLYPNPSVGISKLTLDMVSSENVAVSIFDAEGKLIRSIIVTGKNGARVNEKISIDDLPAGVYVINITQEEFTEVKKLIVIK